MNADFSCRDRIINVSWEDKIIRENWSVLMILKHALFKSLSQHTCSKLPYETHFQDTATWLIVEHWMLLFLLKSLKPANTSFFCKTLTECFPWVKDSSRFFSSLFQLTYVWLFISKQLRVEFPPRYRILFLRCKSRTSHRPTSSRRQSSRRRWTVK